MIEDGIFDGDYIFVRKQLQANRGDIVVAMITDEATVKRYYPEGDTIRFQPANAAMQPILVRKRDFKAVNLIGLVVGVYRKMRG
jgi:repressor LexA